MLQQLSNDEIQELSMIEIAMMLLEEKKQAMDFYELFNEIIAIKGLSQEVRDERIAQFYTDMNVDGRFLCIGENRWGLRSWYPFDQVDEDLHTSAKSKKKKAKKKAVVEDDLDIEDIDDEDFLDPDDIDYSDDEISDDDIDIDDEDDDLLEDDDFDLDEDFDDELEDFDDDDDRD